MFEGLNNSADRSLMAKPMGIEVMARQGLVQGYTATQVGKSKVRETAYVRLW